MDIQEYIKKHWSKSKGIDHEVKGKPNGVRRIRRLYVPPTDKTQVFLFTAKGGGLLGKASDPKVQAELEPYYGKGEKPALGRPPADKPRNAVIHIRATGDERESYVAAAEAAGETFTGWILSQLNKSVKKAKS